MRPRPPAARDAAAKRGEPVDEQKLGIMRAMTEAMIEKQSDPYLATARLRDERIIDLRDTRTVVAIALSAVNTAPVRRSTSWGVSPLMTQHSNVWLAQP